MPIQPIPNRATENYYIGADYAAVEERILAGRHHWNHPSPAQAARVNYPTQNACAAVDEVNEWMATRPSPAVPMRMEASEGTAWVAPAMGTPASEANAPRPWTTLGAVTGRASSYVGNFAESISTATTSVRQLEITAFTDAEFTAFKTKAARVCDVQIGRTGRAKFSLGINALTFLRLEVTTRNQSGQQYSVQQDADGQTILFGRPVKIVNSVPNGHVELVLESNHRNAIDIYQAQREAVSARSNSSTEARTV